MTHLLDTDVIINHLKKIAPITVPPTAMVAVSVITYAELLCGVEKSANQKTALEAVTSLLSDNSIVILTVTEKLAPIYAKIRANLEKKGLKLDDFDLLIAATALENDLTLVTANKKHFTRIPGLKLL